MVNSTKNVYYNNSSQKSRNEFDIIKVIMQVSRFELFEIVNKSMHVNSSKKVPKKWGKYFSVEPAQSVSNGMDSY